MIDIVEFAEDPNLLNLKLWEKQKEILQSFWEGSYRTGVWALGRRSGKTLMSATVATYAATILADEYRKFLRPSEKFYVVSIANTQDQAKLALQNVKDLISRSPILNPLIVRETSDTLELSNGAVFKALPTSSRSGRGMACCFLIFDEIAYSLDTDGNAGGDALYQALSPSVAQFGNLGKILLLSSPWIQQGIFWNLFKQANTGQYSYMQCVNLPTWEVNPTISKEFLEQEKARDPELFAVEYGANFSQTLSGFVSGELVDNAINPDRTALPPLNRFKGSYYLSLDPAKGSRDAYTACIAHYDGDRFVIDLWHQFSPSWSDGKKTQVNIAEVEAWILDKHFVYKFAEVVLDQYNSAATIQRLSHKLKIREQTWSSPSKTEAFSKLRELFNSGKIELYPHEKANQQIKNLTVTYRSSGAWSVSGGTGGSLDDYPAALAGAVLAAQEKKTHSSADWLRYL